MILGLRACGIPTVTAAAVDFVQRLFTGCPPPVSGWFALTYLQHKEHL